MLRAGSSKGFLIQGEAVLSAFVALLAITILISFALRFDAHWSQRLLWERKQLEADALADTVAKRLADGGGNVDASALAKMEKGNAEILLGAERYGQAPPANVSVFYVRRLVFVAGAPEIMEVRVW